MIPVPEFCSRNLEAAGMLDEAEILTRGEEAEMRSPRRMRIWYDRPSAASSCNRRLQQLQVSGAELRESFELVGLQDFYHAAAPVDKLASS